MAKKMGCSLEESPGDRSNPIVADEKNALAQASRYDRSSALRLSRHDTTLVKICRLVLDLGLADG